MRIPIFNFVRAKVIELETPKNKAECIDNNKHTKMTFAI